MVETIKFLMAVQNALRSAGIYVNTATATEVARSLNESGMVVGERRTDGELAGLDERVLAYENEIELLKNVIEGLRQAPVERFLFQDGKIIPLNRWEWISVRDRLPEKGGRYLVFDGDTGNYYDSYFDETEGEFGEWQNCFDPFTLGVIDCEWNSCPNVTHWMPLPQPPKGE